MALPLTIAGGAVSAIGDITGGIASANNARYQAQVAANNATIEQQNANYAIQAGKIQTQNVGQQGRAQIGKIVAGQAASGVDVNSGSALDVRTSQAETNQQNEMNTMNNALLQSYGYRSQAANYTAQSQLDQSEASQDEIGGFMNAGGSLLSNASQIATKWGGGDPISSLMPNSTSDLGAVPASNLFSIS